MSSVLVNGLTEVFKSQVASPFASKFGESESSSIRGFETSIGAMLLAMRGKIGQSGFVRQLFGLINSPASASGLMAVGAPSSSGCSASMSAKAGWMPRGCQAS